jgi:hypothetical protein
MKNDYREFSDDELARRLREAAAAWFKNEDLLMLEELIRRAQIRRDALLSASTAV